MYLMYADESGNTGTDYDNKEQPIFVLAGVLVEDRKWHKINKLFNQRKVEILSILETETSLIFIILSPTLNPFSLPINSPSTL